MHNINKPELLSKVLINVLLISLFITFFFFTYGSYIEGKIVNEQMVFLSKDIKSIFDLFGKNTSNFITDRLNNMELPDLTEKDNKAKQNNDEIKNNSLKILSLFALFVLFIIYLIYNKYNNYELNKLVSESIIILIGIAVTEYVFITYFAARYISINPSVAKLAVLESIKEKIN